MQVRTIRRNLEVFNLWALSIFAVLGMAIFILGVVRSSTVLIIMGVLYAGATALYLWHLTTRVATTLHFDTSTGVVTWRAPRRHGNFALSAVQRVRQSPQPDVYKFVVENARPVRFWHRNHDRDAQLFFAELRRHQPQVSFDPLYAGCRGSWRRGLPQEGETGTTSAPA